MSERSILVTGGAGFIGANLVRLLLDEGYYVRVLDNFSTGCREYLAGLDLKVIEGDILDTNVVSRAVAGVDGVVHLAAQTGVPGSLADPRRDCEVNVIGTLNLLEACRAVQGSTGAEEQGSWGAEGQRSGGDHPGTSAPPHLRFIFASSKLHRDQPESAQDD